MRDTLLGILAVVIIAALIGGAVGSILKYNRDNDSLYKEACSDFESLGYVVYYSWMDCKVLVEGKWYTIFKPAHSEGK